MRVIGNKVLFKKGEDEMVDLEFGGWDFQNGQYYHWHKVFYHEGADIVKLVTERNTYYYESAKSFADHYNGCGTRFNWKNLFKEIDESNKAAITFVFRCFGVRYTPADETRYHEFK